MNRCPCCNARLNQAATCPRCQADLSLLINTRLTANCWLYKAIHYWLENKTEKCIDALLFSLHLKKTTIAVSFRDYIIQQLSQNVLDLLVKKRLLSAKQDLYKSRRLFRYSQQLQQLNMFADYQLTRHHKKT